MFFSTAITLLLSYSHCVGKGFPAGARRPDAVLKVPLEQVLYQKGFPRFEVFRLLDCSLQQYIDVQQISLQLRNPEKQSGNYESDRMSLTRTGNHCLPFNLVVLPTQ